MSSTRLPAITLVGKLSTLDHLIFVSTWIASALVQILLVHPAEAGVTSWCSYTAARQRPPAAFGTRTPPAESWPWMFEVSFLLLSWSLFVYRSPTSLSLLLWFHIWPWAPRQSVRRRKNSILLVAWLGTATWWFWDGRDGKYGVTLKCVELFFRRV